MELDRQLSSYDRELTFTGEYGTILYMCTNPTAHLEIPGGNGLVGQKVTGDSPSVVLTYASVLEKKHLDLHLKAGTEPCSMGVSPVSAIFRNKVNEIIWIGLNAYINRSRTRLRP